MSWDKQIEELMNNLGELRKHLLRADNKNLEDLIDLEENSKETINNLEELMNKLEELMKRKILGRVDK